MSTIQNLKNFIRHGKQAREPHTVKGSPAPAAVVQSTAHAQSLRKREDQSSAPMDNRQRHQQPPPHANSEPVANDTAVFSNAAQKQHGISVDPRNNVGNAAKAGHIAAQAVNDQRKQDDAKAQLTQNKQADPEVLERIIAEEREAKGKLPNYPGLERYQLIEKMGDGAFSNVYRARDTTGQYPEVAVKVVRKFEMNATQVCRPLFEHSAHFPAFPPSFQRLFMALRNASPK